MTTSRIQLALNVADIEAAAKFYADMFGVQPAKQRPGYANFVVADPPLKLVLFENAAQCPRSTTSVWRSPRPPTYSPPPAGSPTPPRTTPPRWTRCAVQDKAWVEAPTSSLGAWEFYTVLDDDPTTEQASTGTCCARTG